ncbi:MAG: hypothetical protein JNG84_03770 [Archangium sp.]|nr:hypothetical protein [Archangium sp.]
MSSRRACEFHRGLALLPTDRDLTLLMSDGGKDTALFGDSGDFTERWHTRYALDGRVREVSPKNFGFIFAIDRFEPVGRCDE